jgi:hypothetical protein
MEVGEESAMQISGCIWVSATMIMLSWDLVAHAGQQEQQELVAQNAHIRELITRLDPAPAARGRWKDCRSCRHCRSSKNMHKAELPVLGVSHDNTGDHAVVTFYPVFVCTRCKQTWFPSIPDESFPMGHGERIIEVKSRLDGTAKYSETNSGGIK